MKLAFEEHGDGQSLILLHAFPLSRKMWRGQIESLREKNFRVILPDLRGFGESHNFSDINLIEDMAMDVAELLSDLKIQKAIIGGLSMGGYVAFNLFALFPEKFSALILCDTNASADTEEKRTGRFEMIKKIQSDGADALIENMLPKLIGENTKQNKKDLVREIEEMFAEVKPDAAVAALRAMAERKDHSAVLEKISVPTLLIFGEEDEVTNLDTAKDLNEQIKNSNLVIIKNAGHYSNLEQPEQFNAALTNFAEKVSS